jgi:NAD+ kinase
VKSQLIRHIACVADSSQRAQAALAQLQRRYTLVPIAARKPRAEVIVVLGGDGFMLQTLHKYLKRRIPFYGMNCGSVGFLMNNFSAVKLPERLEAAREAILYPLHMYARRVSGRVSEALAFNEVSLFRQSRQAAKLRVAVDHVLRVPELICDGVLLATAAGSTAYNFSAGGPIIPFGANVIALTPLVPFRPRRWSGALLPHSASVNFDILEPKKRPVSAVADFTEVRDVAAVAVSEQRRLGVTLLFDPERNLEERITSEQFSY